MAARRPSAVPRGRRLAQGDATQVKAPTSLPKGQPRRGLATVANQAQAGTVPSGGRGALAAGDGVLARLGRDQSPSRGEKAALDALRRELGQA